MNRLTNIEVGQPLDVRSPEHVWCPAIIKRIVYRQELNCKILTVHYVVGTADQGFPSEYDEHIAENSCRLARYRFYTCRDGSLASADIPKLTWIETGAKIITYKGQELTYNFLGKFAADEEMKGLIESDEEK